MSEIANEIAEALTKTRGHKASDGSYNYLRSEPGLSNNGEDKALDRMLRDAVAARASDLHILAGSKPKARVDGRLVPLEGWPELNGDAVKNILSAILTKETAEEFERSGDLDMAYTEKEAGRFRVNYYKQKGCWSAVFRTLASYIPTPEELGIPPQVVDLIHKKRGLILVTGPTGSGKSTTLASLIQEINKRYEHNIITLEDPIEYLHSNALRSNVAQREMGVDSKSFASGLKAALREDPDVILVGEMRDPETIQTAVTAAETGHLVFSTLHTMGASNTIDRIIDSYPPSQQGQARSQLASILECVLSQALLPKAEGKGRVAAFEIMLGTTAIKAQISEGKTKTIGQYMQPSLGMQTLDQHLLDLVTIGEISPEKALEFAQDRRGLSERLGIR